MVHWMRCLGVVLLFASALAADEWIPITCPPADLPTESMFRTKQLIDDFESAKITWHAAAGGQNARCALARDTTVRHSGRATLRADYEFVGTLDYEYVQLGKSVEIAGAGDAIGFWLKHDGTPFPVRLRIVDTSGETHQIEMMAGNRAGWQYVAGHLDGPSTSWGGDGNGRRNYPCRLDGILLDRPRQGFVGQGSAWIDDVALLRPRELSNSITITTRGDRVLGQFSVARFGNLYAVGDAVSLRVSGEGDRIRWRVKDFWDHVLSQGEGKAAGTQLQFKLARPGYYCCDLELIRDGQPIEIRKFCCAALLNGSEPARNDFVGVCSHYGQANYPLPSMKLMRDYGIDQFRDEISWRSYERKRGEFAMPGHAKAYLDYAARLNMRPLIIYDYSNPLYDNDGFPNSPEAIAAFARYAVDLTLQTRGKVAMFEVWNEWIGGCGMRNRPGDHGAEAYGRLLKATYSAVKKAFPDVAVVGIGGEYGSECAENIVKSLSVADTDSMDGWSIHPYRYPRQPEQSELVGEIRRIAQRVRETGAQQKIWITEVGWPTHRTNRGCDERVQARYCVRTMALLQSTGLVEKVFWYDFKDDGTNRDYNEHNFGLVRHQTYNCAPKPGIAALSVFVRMTAGAAFQGLRKTGSTHTAHYTKPDGRDVIVAWTSGDPQRITIQGDVNQLIDIMGASLPVSKSFELSENPVYVVGRRLNLEIGGANE